MIARKTKYLDLPLRMTKREYVKRDGTTSTRYYYECPRDENGKKKVIPLGTDLTQAKIKWAELEGKPVFIQSTIDNIFEKYWHWIEKESGLRPETIRNYENCWKKLKPAFGKMNVDKVKPQHLLQYYTVRSSSSKIRAKAEINCLSTFFSWARVRGLMTNQNPVIGVKRFMPGSSRRKVYVSDKDFAIVYQYARQGLKDAMRIAFLTGQRPRDVLNMKWSNIKDSVLTVNQSKTGQTVRIAVTGELKETLNEIKNRPVIGTYIINNNGNRMSLPAMERQFRVARKKAITYAENNNIEFQSFQFRDLRAKAATDSDTEDDAKQLLGHKQITTTAIYRRDKKQAVSPVKSKNFLDLNILEGKRKEATN